MAVVAEPDLHRLGPGADRRPGGRRRPRRAPRPRAPRGQPVPRRQPAGEAAARLRRAGRRAGARRRRPHRRPRARRGALLHAYFLRPGDPSIPIIYEVDRIRDGRSFTTRRVVAIQHGKAIFNLAASFQKHEEGLEHQVPMPEDVPPPETLPTFQERWAAARRGAGRVVHPAPPDRHRRVDWSPADRRRPLPPQPARVAAGLGPAPRRPDPAHLRAHLRVGHDPARHHARSPTAASTTRRS